MWKIVGKNKKKKQKSTIQELKNDLKQVMEKLY